MENVDAYFSDVRYVRDDNDWTIEEVNATKQAIEDIEKKIALSSWQQIIEKRLTQVF